MSLRCVGAPRSAALGEASDGKRPKPPEVHIQIQKQDVRESDSNAVHAELPCTCVGLQL